MNILGWLIPIVIIISALATAKFAHLNKLSWKHIIPAIVIPSVPVAVWDYYFTDWGIWANTYSDLLTVLLFYPAMYLLILITYLLIKQKVIKEYLNQAVAWVMSVLVFTFLAVLWFTNIKTTFLSIPTLFSAFLMLIIFVMYKRDYTQSFFFTYAALLIPYFIIKQIYVSAGTLTYNKDMLTGLYIWGVPVEELIILFALVIMSVIMYEYLEKRSREKSKDQ